MVLGAAECPPAVVTAVVAEYWPAKATGSRFARLPLETFIAMRGRRFDDAWILGKLIGSNASALVHFDGVGFSLLSGRFAEGSRDLALYEDEHGRTALAILDGQLIRRWSVEDGELEPVALPDACHSPQRLWRSADAWWLGCDSGLFSTEEKVQSVFDWPQTDLECEAKVGKPGAPRRTIRGGPAPSLEGNCPSGEPGGEGQGPGSGRSGSSFGF